MCVCVGGGGGNASLSQLNVQKNSRALVRRGGGGLKFEKRNNGKTIKSTPKKKMGICPHVFCTFSFAPTQ